MRKHRLIPIGLLAALSLLLATQASANRLSLSHGSLWRATWANLQFNGPLGNVFECALTLEGSFHSGTIRKVERALIGHITHATLANPCRRGRGTILAETLPWHVTYDGFTGRLPFIETIKLLLIGFSYRLGEVPLLGECLLRSETGHPIVDLVRATYETVTGNGIINSLTAEEGARIPCVNGANSVELRFGGTASVTEVPGGSANLLIRLI